MYWGVFNLVLKSLNGLSIWIGGLIAARICPSKSSFWGDSFLGRSVWVEQDAIRSMGIAAGGMLILGVLVYSWVNKTSKNLTV
jgi:hypothetical protein